MLQEKLKEATKHNHDTLEQLMYVYEIMDGTLSIQHYKQILTTNYLVHKHIEATLTNGLSPELAQRITIQNRHKLPALIADLHDLQINIPDYAISPTLEIEKNDAALLGALYVLEGATLGGNVIVKRLKVNPNLNSLNLGFHYYQVYGETLISNWKNFCIALNEQPEETYADSIQGAKQVFDFIAEIQKAQIKAG